MRFGVTVNIGNYQSLKFDSNEYETLDECLKEVIECLERFNDNNDANMMRDYLARKYTGD